jgi:outer membrane protein assembly factor BamB
MNELMYCALKIRRCVLLAICWVVCHFAAATIRADEWPEFRGPTGQGLAVAAELPIKWDQSIHVAWRRPIEGKGWSSPVIYQGNIYLTTAVPQSEDESGEQSLRAICLNAATGKQVWNVQVFLQSPHEQTKIHTKNSFASPTPLVDGQKLYVHFGPNGTAALDLNGQLVWKTQEIQYDARHGGGGSPILSGRSLIINCDGVERPFVVALDRDSGLEIWRTYRPEVEPERFSFATPLEIDVQGQRQVVSPGSSVACSYAPDTGREIWHVRYPKKWSIIPRPVFAHGLVYVCTGYEGPAEILAIRPDGMGDVTDTHVAWRSKEYVPHTPSPLIVDDKLFLLSDEGVASCRDALSGKLHWRKRLGGNYSSSPIYANGRVYFPSEEGECVVVAADAEFAELARNDLGEQTLASYAVGDGALFVRTAEHLYRIDAERRSGP